MATNIDSNQLLQLLSLFQSMKQPTGSASTESSSTKSGMSPSQFWAMWESDDGSDSFLDWEEGDDVYWSDSSGSDEAFWNYVDPPKEESQNDVMGMLTQLLASSGSLSELLGGSGEGLNFQA